MIYSLIFLIPFGNFALSEPPRNEAYLTLLSTNDIHGGVEPSKDKNGKLIGGMALLGGVVRAIREGIEKKVGNRGAVLLLDAGDQFQGTLISNYNKGQLVFSTMNTVKYDAVVPGNHDYDFGPAEGEEDTSPDPAKKREALERLANQVRFPLISANTFFKDSFKDTNGNVVNVHHEYCRPTVESPIDWASVKRPEFLRPWVKLNVTKFGIKVAIVGLDHPRTARVTTFQNVSDLCFEDEFENYKRMLGDPKFDADMVVLVMHNGNTTEDKSVTELVRKIAGLPNHRIVAVVSGHTHWTYREIVSGIPLVQSGSGGQKFGRIDLVWDTKTKSIVSSKTKVAAGIQLLPDTCDIAAVSAGFCTINNGKPAYDSVLVSEDVEIKEMIAKARAEIQTIAIEKMGEAEKTLTRHRILESNLADEMSDSFRKLAKTDITLINTGGLRADIEKGSVTYEDLFRVFPFNNHALVVKLPADKLINTLKYSVKTCGKFGSLMQSGLRVIFERNCSGSAAGKIDPKARLLHVETADGNTVIFDARTQPHPDSRLTFRVATFDFILNGGDGFDLAGNPVEVDLGIFREMLRQEFRLRPVKWKGDMDGRWQPQQN